MPPPVKGGEKITDLVDNHFECYNAARIRECCELLSKRALASQDVTVGMSLSGAHHFQGASWLRPIYLVILFSHMVLAVVLVPLVLRTLYLAFKQDFEKHKRLVRFTFPIWLYVSVTGVTIYVLLYQVTVFS